jgi:hypothetical protein
MTVIQLGEREHRLERSGLIRQNVVMCPTEVHGVWGCGYKDSIIVHTGLRW